MPPRQPVELNAFSDRIFAAVLFDMDGTLIDSDGALAIAWTQWAIAWQIPAEAFTDVAGNTTRDIVRELVPAGSYDEALADILAREVATTDGIVPLPGARRALQSVPAQCGAIVTSSTHAVALARLRAAGLPMAGLLITADDVERGKPDPQPYLVAAEDLGVDPADCLVVEDSQAGVDSGRAAGMPILAVHTSHTPETLTSDAWVPHLNYVDWIVTPTGIEVVRRGSRG